MAAGEAEDGVTMTGAAERVVDALPVLVDAVLESSLPPDERRQVLEAIATVRNELTADLPEWLTYRQAAKVLSASYSTVKRKVAKGLIVACHRDPFNPRIHRDEIQRYLNGKP